MIGPEGLKVPSQLQDLNLGGKTAADLISADTVITIDGTDVTAKGTAHNITEPWTAFSTADNTGHFFPLQLPAVCKGKSITCKGRVAGDRVIDKVDNDLLLVTRLENLKANVLTVEMDGEVLMTADFTGVTREGD